MTCSNKRIDRFDSFQPDCVQVISSGGYRKVAQFGDISGKLARKFGAKGAIVDAPTRDTNLLNADKFPMFCQGSNPVDAYGKWQIVQYQVPIHMPGVSGEVLVKPGDIIFADADGILVIPINLLEEVSVCSIKRFQKEAHIRDKLCEVEDIVALNDEVGRW